MRIVGSTILAWFDQLVDQIVVPLQIFPSLAREAAAAALILLSEFLRTVHVMVVGKVGGTFINSTRSQRRSGQGENTTYYILTYGFLTFNMVWTYMYYFFCTKYIWLLPVS